MHFWCPKLRYSRLPKKRKGSLLVKVREGGKEEVDRKGMILSQQLKSAKICSGRYSCRLTSNRILMTAAVS